MTTIEPTEEQRESATSREREEVASLLAEREAKLRARVIRYVGVANIQERAHLVTFAEQDKWYADVERSKSEAWTRVLQECAEVGALQARIKLLDAQLARLLPATTGIDRVRR